MSRDRRLLFVVLAAIGAYFIAYGVASGIGFELWTSGKITFPPGPPRLEPTLAVGTFAGGFVAWRLGGWRGVLAFGAVGVIGALRHLFPLIQCVSGDAAICQAMTDLDFVIPQLWLVPGLTLGVFAANLVRVEIPLRAELEAAGVFALAGPIRFLVAYLPSILPSFHGADGALLYRDELRALDVALVLAAALLTAIFLVRRSRRPGRSGRLLAAMITVVALPWLTYQLRYPVTETVELVGRLSYLVAAALILIRHSPAFGDRAIAAADRRAHSRLISIDQLRTVENEMSAEWKGLPFGSSGPTPSTGHNAMVPTMGPSEGYLGNIVVEVWRPDASSGDGLRFSAYSVEDSSLAGNDKFLRETIARLSARLAGQQLLG